MLSGADARKLRAKVMECAVLLGFVAAISAYLSKYLAAAVGPDVFRPDAM
jgi:hypothetical protein